MCIVLIIPGHSHEVYVNFLDIVNPEYNDDSSPDITLININNMKFQLIVLEVCFLFFYTYDSANFKSMNNTMKKSITRFCWPCLLQDVLNRRLLFKTNPAYSSTKGKPSPIISSFPHFLEFGQKKALSIQPICGGAENVVKTETRQTFVNG